MLTHPFSRAIGSRFAPPRQANALLSWGLSFGHALLRFSPGDYVCNQSMLDAFAVSRLDVTLPPKPNFADHLFHSSSTKRLSSRRPRELRQFRPHVCRFRRPGKRGVGTRNSIVILGTTSRTASFARQLTARLQSLARIYPSIDGIVAIAHTEGGGQGEPNNSAEVLRALAGFMVHPNVGAVLAVDFGVEPITNARLQRIHDQRAAIRWQTCRTLFSVFARVSRPRSPRAKRSVRAWLPASQPRSARRSRSVVCAWRCSAADRTHSPASRAIRSRARWCTRSIRHGGIGVLCETDEIGGAEAYLMKNVRDLPTARALLTAIDSFRARLSWHGVTPESNPSAGNKLRGLYNIALKSLGAVHKKDPRTRVDHVINYADPLGAPGFYFMDSPGNDLEGIAGQVGAGCNLFLFVTGNGSITNFPFVPTLKLTTTTRRHQLLIHEMDINAGRYLDGESMESLTAESFDLLIATASGRKTRGEHAGHSQASLWRNWRQTDSSHVAEIRARAVPDGKPLVAEGVEAAVFNASVAAPAFQLLRTNDRWATERVGLVLPTSMCSAQIARLASERMNAKGLARALGFNRFVTLTHSEGCGFGGESMYHLLHRTYRGYATHPNVAAALLLEHGCEKIPNDAMRRQFESAGLPLDRFGWASVQLDGGIDNALAKIEAWFERAGSALTPTTRLPADLGALTLGVLSTAPVGKSGAAVFAKVARAVLDAGGSVLLPEGDPLLAVAEFRTALFGTTAPRASLAYGQPLTLPGLHLVATDSDHWVENLAGLGGCGAHLLLGLVGNTPQQGHPLLPLLQVAEPGALTAAAARDVDLVLTGELEADGAEIFRLLGAIAQGDVVSAASAGGFVDFQLSRGLLGVST